jgi:hypothetical protein
MEASQDVAEMIQSAWSGLINSSG